MYNYTFSEAEKDRTKVSDIEMSTNVRATEEHVPYQATRSQDMVSHAITDVRVLIRIHKFPEVQMNRAIK